MIDIHGTPRQPKDFAEGPGCEPRKATVAAHISPRGPRLFRVYYRARPRSWYRHAKPSPRLDLSTMCARNLDLEMIKITARWRIRFWRINAGSEKIAGKGCPSETDSAISCYSTKPSSIRMPFDCSLCSLTLLIKTSRSLQSNPVSHSFPTWLGASVAPVLVPFCPFLTLATVTLLCSNPEQNGIHVSTTSITPITG